MKKLIETSIFNPQKLKLLRKKDIPSHVAIINDGNRRWAKKRSLSQFINVCEGHYAGAEIIQDILAAAQELGIKTLTLWALSTENWRRPKHEIETLITLIENYLIKNCDQMVNKGVKLSLIGDLTPFPESLKKVVRSVIKKTEEGKSIELVLALNYGGRDDIKRAFQKMIAEKKWNSSDISEELISSYLDTASLKDPDLLIRTSNEMRVSNFLLWQIAYTEIYVCEKLWPDFRPDDLLDAILQYQMRDRRKGE